MNIVDSIRKAEAKADYQFNIGDTIKIAVKIIMKMIALTDLKTIFKGILLIKTSNIADSVSRANAKIFSHRKLATIYVIPIMIFILGSSLCITEFEG